jgi:plasmid stability protein
MPILHVRNVPDELYSRLKQQAQAKNRSISAEVILLLDRALAGVERGPRCWRRRNPYER